MTLDKRNEMKRLPSSISKTEPECGKFEECWIKDVRNNRNLIKQIKARFFEQLLDFEFESQTPSQTHFSKFQTLFTENRCDAIFLDFLRFFDSTGKSVPDDRFQGLLCFLMDFSKKPLAASKGETMTPLIYSLQADMDLATKTILQRDKLNDAVEHTAQDAHGTCIHVAITFDSPYLEEIIKESSKFPDQFSRVNKYGNTPLHMLCEYLGDEVYGVQIESKEDSESEARVQHDNGSDCQRPTLYNVEYRLKLLEQILELSMSVLKSQNGQNRTAYQLRIHALLSAHANAKQQDTDFNEQDTIAERQDTIAERQDTRATQQNTKEARKLIAEDPIACALRDFCIRKCKSRDEMMACLYQSGEERHLEFDLAGFSSPFIHEEFLDRLADHIQFESVLRYVALPKLTIKPSKARNLAASNDPGVRILDNLEFIFEWLRRHGVTRIIKVAVIDHGHDCHNDSTIKRSLEGFQIEYWNWKKMDICSDVISKSTRIVQEVSLYWSGNAAVMMGWASDKGFLDKSKFPKLRKITIFYREGYEELSILEAELRQFRRQMETSDPLNPIEVIAIRDNEDGGYATDFKSNVDQPTSHPWLDAMKNFSSFLRMARKSLPKNRGLEPIKIAIIDDGIDASQSHLQRRIAKGKSFSPYPNSDEFVNAYFIPQGRHGTLMADLICRICPEPKLYVARLEEQLVSGGGRRITVNSAADAIEWAVSCNVHIISMSWTFDSHDMTSPDMVRLEKAITEAKSRHILMFRSASDQGDKEIVTDTSPFTGCIRIGGASALGKELTWVNSKTVKYLFPGKQIPFKNEEDQSITHETGSSLATACATGLAGALLYSQRILNITDKLLSFSDSKNMEKAFQSLQRNPSPFVDAEHNLVKKLEGSIRKLQDKPPNAIIELGEAGKTTCALDALQEVLNRLT